MSVVVEAIGTVRDIVSGHLKLSLVETVNFNLNVFVGNPSPSSNCFKAGVKYRKNGDFLAAVWCFQKVGKSRDSEAGEALNVLGVMFREGEGVRQDDQEAEKNFRESACLKAKWFSLWPWRKWSRKPEGSVEGLYNLAKLYESKKKKHLKDEAIKYFHLSAKDGFIPAQLHLVKIGKDLKEVGPKEVKLWGKRALRTCRKGAELGDLKAQYWLAKLHEKGWCLPSKDLAEAVHWYKKAACHGHTRAPLCLGVLFCKGEGGVAQDYKEARNWFLMAARWGTTVAQYNLGVLSRKKGDFKEARLWFLKAAEQGYAEAQHNLGVMYSNGDGVEQDYKEARLWFVMAADQEDAAAQFALGVMYYEGQGVKQNSEKARHWHQESACQGHAGAQCNLGVMYYNGQDYGKARLWCEKAANQGGAAAALAQFALGVMSSYGEGGEEDLAEAARWWQKAADWGYAKAQYNLGLLYYDGKGVVAQNYEQARLWSEKAADQGHAKAQFFLGVLYLNSEVGTKEYAKARCWFEKAEKQGDAIAQCALGVMEDQGLGVKENPLVANIWWKKAADQGLVDAQYRLGVRYNEGRDVVRNDTKEAYIYLEVALKLLERLGRNSPEEHPASSQLEKLAEDLDNLKKKVLSAREVSLKRIIATADARENAEVEIEKRMEKLNRLNLAELTEVNKGFFTSGVLNG